MGSIVQVNTSRGGLPKRAVPGGFISEMGLEGLAVDASRIGEITQCADWTAENDLIPRMSISYCTSAERFVQGKSGKLGCLILTHFVDVS